MIRERSLAEPIGDSEDEAEAEGVAAGLGSRGSDRPIVSDIEQKRHLL
jgi:hypothetical protein